MNTWAPVNGSHIGRRRETGSWRRLGVGAFVALTLGLAACSGGTGGESDPVSDADASGGASETPAGADEPAVDEAFCADVSALEALLPALTEQEVDDPAGMPTLVADGATVFASVTPPAEIEMYWEGLGSFVDFMAQRLVGVQIETNEDLAAALSVESGGTEALGRILALPGQIEVVGVYLQDACGMDLGLTASPIADVCAAIDSMSLGSVFATVPEGESIRWGDGIAECTWSAEDKQVGAVVLPASQLAGIVGAATKLSEAGSGDLTISIYDGAFGVGRAEGGRTAIATVGDAAVMASVATGDTAAEETKAVALAGMLADALP